MEYDAQYWCEMGEVESQAIDKLIEERDAIQDRIEACTKRMMDYRRKELAALKAERDA